MHYKLKMNTKGKNIHKYRNKQVPYGIEGTSPLIDFDGTPGIGNLTTYLS